MQPHEESSARFHDSLGRPWSLLEVRVPSNPEVTRCLLQVLFRQGVRVMIHLTYPLDGREMLHRLYVCDSSGIELNAPRKHRIEKFIRRFATAASPT